MGTPAMLGTSEEVQEHLVRSIVFRRRMGRPEEFALLVESIAATRTSTARTFGWTPRSGSRRSSRCRPPSEDAISVDCNGVLLR
jgi:hypothetical protein